MNEIDDRQLNMIKQWLETLIGENDNGPVSVKERIAYLVVCNGGYCSNADAIRLSGTVVGPFTIGLSLAEMVEHTYYVGMLSGMGILCVDPYTIMDSYIEEYLTEYLSSHIENLDVVGIIKDGILDIRRLLNDHNYMNPEHGGDNN